MGSAWFWDTFAVTISIVAVIAILTVGVGRDMRRGGTGRSVHANPLGAMDEVFHPAAHRAREELRHWDEISETIPSPDGDDRTASGLRLTRGPDGLPRAARIIRKP